jgi:hypothetical protein
MRQMRSSPKSLKKKRTNFDAISAVESRLVERARVETATGAKRAK